MEIDASKTTIKKLDRMVKIISLFDNDRHREYTPEDAFNAFVNKYPDVKITQKDMYVILKEMYDSSLLSRERRTVKSNPSGRVLTSSKYFYRPSKMVSIIEEELNGYIAKSKDAAKTMNKVDTSLSKDMGARLYAASKTNVTKIDDEPKKDYEKKEQPETHGVQMSFNEALMKLYSGSRIVSAVSGNVYTIVDKDNLKGITCSSKPGVIISFFPTNEMEGMWRLMETPKSCPYCGGMAKLVCNGTTYQYVCTDKDCQATGPHAKTPEEAVIRFNARV